MEYSDAWLTATDKHKFGKTDLIKVLRCKVFPSF